MVLLWAVFFDPRLSVSYISNTRSDVQCTPEPGPMSYHGSAHCDRTPLGITQNPIQRTANVQHAFLDMLSVFPNVYGCSQRWFVNRYVEFSYQKKQQAGSIATWCVANWAAD